MAAACGDESDESGGAAMSVLDWEHAVLLIAVLVATCVLLCYVLGTFAGVRECKQIMNDFFASLEKKEDGKD